MALESEPYTEAALAAWKPDPLLTVSEWADRHRVLSQRASAEPGRWRTRRTPYLKEIMDALSPSSPVEQVVLQKGAQVGCTEAGNNWLAYVVDHAPGPMMAVSPTVEAAKRNSRHRIDPLIAECPRLLEKIREPRSRDGGNTMLSKEFPGGVLVLTGANSAVGLRSMPVRYLFMDEVDAYPSDLDGEGNPLELALARTRTFARRKILMVSTPTITGRSRIEAAFEGSDQRYYHVPCPECGHRQPLRWAHLRWEPGIPESARYACESCGTLIEEHHKTAMLEAGEWVPRKPDAPPEVRGYHLSALYSPLGWFSWCEAAAMWERAKKRPDALRVFVNTVLGETWQERGEAPDWKRLYQRREEYELGKVPRDGLVLTAGVDVQKDRLEVEVVAWGRDRESWSVEYLVFAGDPSRGEVWAELDRLLSKPYPHELGGQALIWMLAVDAGYQTAAVYTWSRRKPANRVMAIKGSATSQVLVGAPTRVDVNLAGRRLRGGAHYWPVGVGIAKGELYGWLRQDPPVDRGDGYPPGFCHFPTAYTEEYFQQLTAEELVSKLVRGYRRYEWQKIRERNEALDCRIYARAAAAVVGVDRFTEADWCVLAQQFRPDQQPRAARPKRRMRLMDAEFEDRIHGYS